MTGEAWFVVGTIAIVIAALASNRVGADTAMLGGLVALLLGDALFGGVLPWQTAIGGFAHPAIVMIAALFVVAAGLRETGAIDLLTRRLLGRPRTIAGAQFRLMVPVAALSAVMNNTPIVAMYLPIVSDWCRKCGFSPSKLYMPLSFAATLGGKMTLIGTASNIVVMGLYADFVAQRLAAEAAGTAPAWLTALGVEPLTRGEAFWSVAVLGVPTTIAGIAIVMLTSRRLLPERRPAGVPVRDARQYELEMEVLGDAPIVGRTIEEAGLRHLPGLYLAAIERDGDTLAAVGPEERLHAGDRLWFTGVLDSVVDLRKIRGLVPATDQVGKVRAPVAARTLVEAVVSRSGPLAGRSVKESRFRTRYNAAIIAVHRGGEPIRRKIGEIVLRPGDTLLLDTHREFLELHRNSRDFYLVSQVADSRPIRHERAWLAILILLGLVASMTLLPIAPPVVALAAAGAMVLTRCVSGSVARASVSWQVLVVIGAALGLGAALEHTRAAEQIAHVLLGAAHGLDARGMFVIIFVLALLFSQFVSNNGAAVLVFPIATATAESLGASPLPFAIGLMVAAGSTYLTPISYQCNLMVYGPGGYRFLDYARLGLPISIMVVAVCAVVAPWAFPFRP